MESNFKIKIFKNLGASNLVAEELTQYTSNKFDFSNYKELIKEPQDQGFLIPWRQTMADADQMGIEASLNKNLPHGEEDIKLITPEETSVIIYNSIAGDIPVIYAKNEEDFYELVTKLVHKGKRPKDIKKTGACFAFGKTIRFIILSNKPYSNIPAQEIGLEEDQWKQMSMIIRREHETTHYFTKRFLGSSQNNLHDELVADFVGIHSAAGQYHAKWFLLGMGIDKYPKEQDPGRFAVYTKGLSEDSLELLKEIIIKVAQNVETWSKDPEVKRMERNERVLYLCKKDLIDLYYLYN